MWLTVIGWKLGLVYKIVDLPIRIFFFECYGKDISA